MTGSVLTGAGADRLSAIGLMSGTSMDGIDVAHLVTDGRMVVTPGPFLTIPYTDELRSRLSVVVKEKGRVDSGVLDALSRDLTDAHGNAVSVFLDQTGLDRADIDLIGFHGHTIFHDPARRITHQIGDGYRLAAWTGIDVINDFRSADVAAGGQGAPLAPIYHRALASTLRQPVAVLNIGGVANVTFIDGDTLLAFDTGPGNALLDDWMQRHTGSPCDWGGRMAQRGRVHHRLLQDWLSHPYFTTAPPKSLDRNAFDVSGVEALSPEDGAATLTAFTVSSCAAAMSHFPSAPVRWLVTGGGRHNPVIMDGLQASTGALVQPVEAVGWRGDALEAEAFAYLAVRAARCMPLSFPGTTGAPSPMTGAVYHPADNRRNGSGSGSSPGRNPGDSP